MLSEMTFGEKLYSLRRARKLSRAELSLRTRKLISAEAIKKLESDASRSPRAVTVHILASVLPELGTCTPKY